MIKIITWFLIVFFGFFLGIDSFRRLTGKEKWDLTKGLFYSILCASATIGLIALIVLLF